MNPVGWTFELAFGCRHNHKTRVFTIRERTYKVCLDCGKEFVLPDAHLSGLAPESTKKDASLRSYIRM